MGHTFIFLCAMMLATCTHGTKMHERMTVDEIKTTFGTTHDKVPEYNVIPVAHGKHKEFSHHRIIQLTVFSVPMTLYLEPTDGHLAGTKTPVFKTRFNATDKAGITFEQIPNVIKAKPNLFHDKLNGAALSIKYDKDGKALISGIIDDVAIRPLPERFRSLFRRTKRDAFSVSNSDHPDFEDTHHHILYRIEGRQQKTRRVQSKIVKRSIPNKNQVPNIIHPQIMVLVDSTLLDVFKKNVNDVIDYLLSFWNGVDLRYRVFHQPEVRLNIAGIILSEDSSFTPFISKNRVTVDGLTDEKVQILKALSSMSEFLYLGTMHNETDKSLSIDRVGLKYDAAVTMSAYDMCQFSEGCINNEKYNCSTDSYTIKKACIPLGYSYTTGACSYSEDEKLMEAVVIIEDRGGFGAIIPAAHELGHLLGASHSLSDVNKCPVDDSYLMSARLTITPNSFIWSNCSYFSIKKFLIEMPRAQCLFNKPVTGSDSPLILPGKLYTRDEQCNRVMGTDACTETVYSSTCDQLFCRESKNSTFCTPALYVAVSEGTACGKGRYCINAECVNESKKEVTLKIGTTAEPEIWSEYE